MGGEAWVLLKRIEEEFGITITAEESARITTVAELYHLVRQKVGPTKFRGCMTTFVFNRVRRSLMEQLGVSRDQVRPDTSLDILFPLPHRREQWERFRKHLGLSIPNLKLPYVLHEIFAYLGIIGGLCGLVMVMASYGAGYPLVAAMMFVGVIGWIMLLVELAKTFANIIPEECKNVGELVWAVLGENCNKIFNQKKGGVHGDPWSALKAVMLSELGGRPEAIKPEARLVKDLGID